MNNKLSLAIRFRELIFFLIGSFFSMKHCPVIFCFHSVSDDDWLFSVPPRAFELLIKSLSDSKEIVKLDGLLHEELDKKNNKVAITFDDGYEDVFSSAYPILKKYKVKACVFISGLPDDYGKFGSLNDKKLLDVKQIKTLKKAGWDIGYHTATHPDLRKFDSSKLSEEIVNSKKRIEKILGFEIEYFAYPYGLFNKKVVDVVKTAGYKFAFTVAGGKLDAKSTYEISRVLVDKYIKKEDLGIINSCQGLYFNKLFTTLLRIKDNLL